MIPQTDTTDDNVLTDYYRGNTVGRCVDIRYQIAILAGDRVDRSTFPYLFD